MVTDEEIAELFGKVVRDLDPRVDAMVRQAERLGRRRRARRRAWIAAGNAAALAVVAGVSLLVGTHQAPLTPARAAAGAATRHRGAGHRPSPRVGRAGCTVAFGFRPGGAQDRVGLPEPGRVGGDDAAANAHHAPPSAAGRSVLSGVSAFSGRGDLEVDYNDGQGAVDLMIHVFPPGTISEPTCPDPLWTDEGPRPAGALPISCTMRTLPGGSVERDAVMYADSFGFYGYDIYETRPDGITVFIQVGNGTLNGLPQVDRATPPGSMAQWEAVVESPAWHV